MVVLSISTLIGVHFLELKPSSKLRCMRPTGGGHLSSTTFASPVVFVAAICSVSLGLKRVRRRNTVWSDGCLRDKVYFGAGVLNVSYNSDFLNIFMI
jgi:hypothetical protein